MSLAALWSVPLLSQLTSVLRSEFFHATVAAGADDLTVQTLVGEYTQKGMNHGRLCPQPPTVGAARYEQCLLGSPGG